MASCLVRGFPIKRYANKLLCNRFYVGISSNCCGCPERIGPSVKGNNFRNGILSRKLRPFEIERRGFSSTMKSQVRMDTVIFSDPCVD